MSSTEELKLIQQYITDINESLKGTSNEDIMALFRRLYEKEQKFAKILQSSANGRKTYLDFIQKIVDSKGGIKLAKSYFRARQDVYLNTVNKAIKEVEPKLMFDVPINYRFCYFALESLAKTREAKNVKSKLKPLKETKRDADLALLFQEIKKLREEIINKHLYLSLNRAKLYKKNSYGMSVDFEDLIQITNEALIIAVDKYVEDDDSSSFHSMAIGRMIASLIETGSYTSPASIGAHARKKLYQIKKLLQSNPKMNTKEISEALNIAEKEISDLMAATVHKSIDDPVSEDSDVRFSEVLKVEEETPEDAAEEYGLLLALRKSFALLSIVEKKVLILKGIRIDD